jgi:hypothetical protein
MPCKKKTAASGQESVQTDAVQQPFVIDPHAAYRPEHIRMGLGLKKHTLGTEIRLGRLRVSRRAGKYYILGEWLLAWLREGEVTRKRKVRSTVGENGQAGENHEPVAAEASARY